MNMHNLRNILIVIATLALPGMDAVAADDRNALQPFSEHGIVDAGLQSGVMVISDSTYYVTDETQVRELGGRLVTLSDLKQGVKVGFNMYGTRAQRYLSDVWILPADTDLNSFADD